MSIKSRKEYEVELHKIAMAKEFKEFKEFDLKNNFLGTDEPTVDDILEKYQRLLESGEAFNMTFPMKSSTGKLFMWDGGVQVRMKKFKNSGKDKPYEIIHRKMLGAERGKRVLGENYRVVVERIDRELNIVHVVVPSDSAERRDKLIKALLESIEQKDYMRVPARVIGFTGRDRLTNTPDGSVVLLDIGNLGIIGAVPKSEWSTEKIKALSHSASIGDVIDVIVTKSATWSSGKVFHCSRRKVMEMDNIDPWKNIETRIPLKTSVIVTPVDLKEDIFFGVVEGLKELEVICDYPDKNKVEKIQEGVKYLGYISRVDEKKKRLAVTIVDKYTAE